MADMPDKENLNELFEQFFNAKDAKEAVEDIRAGEQILRDNPAPEPSKELLIKIKSGFAAGLRLKSARTMRTIVYKAVAVAAAFIIISIVTVSIFEKGDVGPAQAYAYAEMSREIWESDDITTDDLHLAYFITEIEQIEEDILAVESGEYGGIGDYDIDDIEMELIAINTDFWKG